MQQASSKSDLVCFLIKRRGQDIVTIKDGSIAPEVSNLMQNKDTLNNTI